MADFGIVPEGFRQKTFQDLSSEMQDRARELFGPDINTQANAVLGQLFGIVGDQLAELWEAQLAVYRAGQVDSAVDEAQDALYALNGITRLAAAESEVNARMNLDAGASLGVGDVARIGAEGARWIVQAIVTNPEAFEDTVFVDLKSEDLGLIVGNAYSIDSIAVPVAGWNAKAAINSLGSEPFSFTDGETLEVEVDEGLVQVATFNIADFGNILAATAAELAIVLNTDISGQTTIDAGGTVRMTSDTDGIGSAVEVTGGTGNESLGFPVDLIRGMNPSRSAKNICGNAEPYALVDNQRIFVKVDKGSTQTIIFSTGQFSAIGAATAIEVAKAYNASAVGSLAYAVGGKVQIESLTVGVNSAIEVTGGDANPELGFQESVEFFGVSGDAEIGRELETNSEFRLRRELILRRRGSAMVEGIKADIALVEGVTEVFVYENPTDFVDSEGRPAHSIEAVVVGGADVDIAQAVFNSKAAGIQTFRDAGSQGRTETITDSNSVTHDINFNRPEDLQFFVEVDVSVNQNEFGAGDQAVGEQLVKEAIKDVGDSFGIGDDVIAIKLSCAPLGVPGVSDVPSMKFEDSAFPTNTVNFPIDARQRSTFAILDIVVNVAFV